MRIDDLAVGDIVHATYYWRPFPFRVAGIERRNDGAGRTRVVLVEPAHEVAKRHGAPIPAWADDDGLPSSTGWPSGTVVARDLTPWDAWWEANGGHVESVHRADTAGDRLQEVLAAAGYRAETAPSVYKAGYHWTTIVLPPWEADRLAELFELAAATERS